MLTSIAVSYTKVGVAVIGMVRNPIFRLKGNKNVNKNPLFKLRVVSLA